MSETNTASNKPITMDKSEFYQKWRLLKDKLARYGVVAGGLAVIFAVVLIFFYLLYVVFPLFGSASAEKVGQYALPEKAVGQSALVVVEEQNELSARFSLSGQVVFFEVATGKVIQSASIPLPAGVSVSSIAQGSPVSEGVVIFGLSNGQAMVVKPEFKVSFVQGIRKIASLLTYPLGEAPVAINANAMPLTKVALQVSDGAASIVGVSAEEIRIVNLAKEQSLFADEAAWTRTETVLNEPASNVREILLAKDNRSLFFLANNGKVGLFDVVNKEKPPVLKFWQQVLEPSRKLTSFAFLNGDLSLLIGDSTGNIAQWSLVRDKMNNLVLQEFRSFSLSDKPIVSLLAEQRRKGFVAIDSAGLLGIFHSTSERELLQENIGSAAPVASALSPRANALVLEAKDGSVQFWKIDNEHPEVSLSSLWQKVWYESYNEPKFVWQSSSASGDFEPKFSLTPLVFGTLKAAFYAMLVALPLALLGAIYTAYFMAPAMRQVVKPCIEIMGALPTVILGFLAGLWLAPFLEANLAGFFMFLWLAPVGVLVFAFSWQFLPEELRHKIPEGWDAALLVPVILFCGWFAFTIATPIEVLLFNGSLRDWFKNVWGIGYDQRNALVVGIAMGFAVIPSIFSIAEDAIFSVPKHLSVGSLALGATPWQTLSRVVLLTASPGIFSAVMIGLGRAVGETMIVLMATGNTPVMDLSVFQGLRTLAANIAVEMPESEVDSSHYRVLFLAALVLFAFTFVFNTLAEIIRQRLRDKYSSL
ncbi:MAG: ABC transporter permease subunit [Methylococcaceae bacterium]